MTRELTIHRAEPTSGTATSLVIFVHGYGADGRDLIGLSQPLAPHMPDTLFVAPDAPDRSAMNPMGFQWAPIPWLDGSDPVAAGQAFAASAADLDAMIDALMAETGLAPDRVILFGFSQGSMLSMHVAPRRAAPVAGVVAFSGRLLQPEALDGATVSKPPVLLVHGDRDDVVPYASMAEAGDALTKAGFTVYAHTMEGTGHGIAPDGLQVAFSFMAERLGLSPDAG